jgi:hypothetical protein
MNKNTILTYNPALKIFKQREDLVAMAAANSVNDYYSALQKKEPKPCKAIIPSIEESLRRNMSNKQYPEETIDSYIKSIVDELVSKCEKNMFNVQRLGSKVNNSMRHRWFKTGGKIRKLKTRKNKNLKVKIPLTRQ